MEEYSKGVVNYICDKCGKGKMIAFARTMNTIKGRVFYPSKCNSRTCNYVHDMLRHYPQPIEDVLYETNLEKELNENSSS